MATCKVPAADIPIGLRQLMALDQVLMSQKSTIFANKYVVTAAQGEVIFNVKEDSSAFDVMLGGKRRGFHMDLCDESDSKVISLRRPYSLGVSKLQVCVNGVMESVVRQEPTFMKPVLSINNALDKPVLRVKGPWSYEAEADFELQTLEKKRIGCIQKKWGGFAREMFSKEHEFHISFPLDLDVRYKAAVIGACVLIDFLYYERS